VLLGDSGVGKTSIALRYTQDTFQTRTNPTIGASFLMKNMQVEETKIKLQIWDTAGQERFRSLAPMYYRGASAALLVYDLTAAASFGKIKEWVNELRLNVPEDIVMVVVGNKVDRAETHRQLTRDQGEEYARSVGAAFAEVSAKTKEGIEEVFNEVASRLVANRKAQQQRLEASSNPAHESASVDPGQKPTEISDSCCS
jgi:Ras-related protein Rab-21